MVNEILESNTYDILNINHSYTYFCIESRSDI